MNIVTIVPSVAIFLGIIFTLSDWTPKHGIGNFITRSAVTGGKVFIVSTVALYLIMIFAKGI